MKYNFKADFSDAAKALSKFRQSQLPFATTLALTRLAQSIRDIENEQTAKTFKSPTPFTQKSFTIEMATRTKQRIVVLPRQVQEQYLEPYVFGGDRFLGNKETMLVPVNQPVNQYGNLPRGTLARLKARPTVFVGVVKTKAGPIAGVWQRESRAKTKRKRNGVMPSGHLKLLIKFQPTTPAPFEFPFFEKGEEYLRANAMKVFRGALADAMRTSKNRTYPKK